MEDGVGFACALGKALVKNKNLTELLKLQASLQVVSSIVSATIAERRLGGELTKEKQP